MSDNIVVLRRYTLAYCLLMMMMMMIIFCFRCH